MIRRFFLPLLSLAGLAVAIFTVIADDRPSPATVPAAETAGAPFAANVAGAGIVEASSGNIRIGTPVPGIVTAVFVRWNQHVEAGAKLFTIDDRDLQAQLLPAAALVTEAEAALAKARDQLRIGNGTRFEVAAGEAALAVGRARVRQIELDIERRTIRAPISGSILRIDVRPGEFAPSQAAPLMLMGDIARLFVRVSVDESDAWRMRPGAPAIGFIRGNPALKTALRFERIDPDVIPKTSLTGRTTERTDMRVLQAIYSFDPASLAAYVGQEMNVFIEAVPARSSSAVARP